MTRKQPSLRRAQLAAAVVIACAAAACSDPVSHDGVYVNRFNANVESRTWLPWAEADTSPKATPAMVIWEVSTAPEAEPSAEQEAAAKQLIERSFLSATQRGWYEYKRGREDGYNLIFGDEVHYVNEEYLFDGRILDPERPEFLMYYDTPFGKSLVGYMFYVEEPDAHGPQIGGARTVWHYHVWSRARCFTRGVLAIALGDENGQCGKGVVSYRSPEMLHVWLIDHPHGPFATRMRIDPALLWHLVEDRGY